MHAVERRYVNFMVTLRLSIRLQMHLYTTRSIHVYDYICIVELLIPFYINEFYNLTVDWNRPSKIRIAGRCSTARGNRQSHDKFNGGFH